MLSALVCLKEGFFKWTQNSCLIVFIFNTLKMLLHCLLACTVWGKKSPVILPLNKMWLFFLWLLLRFVLHSWFSAIWLWWALVWFLTLFILLVVHWTFWICVFIVSTRFRIFLVIISSNIFLLPHHHLFLWDFNYMYVYTTWYCSRVY